MTMVPSMPTDSSTFNRHIVIAVDGSDNSRRAVGYVAALLVGWPGFEVTLLHVVHAPDEDYFPSPRDRERWIKVGQRNAARWMQDFHTMLIERGCPMDRVHIRIVQRDGPSLAQLILAELKALHARTVVVGRQGLSPKEEFLFGSVSRQIISHIRDCTVWVVQ